MKYEVKFINQFKKYLKLAKKTEQRSGMTYHQFSAEKKTEKRKIIDKTMVVINITTEN